MLGPNDSIAARDPHTRRRAAGVPRTFQPSSDHWMLTIAILTVIGCTAAMPSPLMVIAGMVALCYLAPSEILPALLAISAVLSGAVLILL